MERIIEQADQVTVNASAVVSAIQAYAKINAQGAWVDHLERIDLNAVDTGGKTPTFTWIGRWEKTELRDSYESFIKMDDGRIACIREVGLAKSVRSCLSVMDPGGIGVTFTREPGNLLTWTPTAPLMTWEGDI